VADKVRVGLIGGGPWARDVHAPGLAAHPDVEFAGLWTRRPAAAAELARAHGVTPFDDVAALIEAVDAVAFSVPPEVQAELALDAGRAGRHLILEKPVAESVATAERLVGVVDESGLATIVMLTMRFTPETRDWLANAVATGGWAGGSVRWLSGALLGGPYSDSPWRHAAGSITDIGPHSIDLLDAALGEVTEVAAATYSEPDTWQVLLAHDSGVVSTMSLSMKLPIDPSIVEIDVYGRSGRSQLIPRQTPTGDSYATLLDEFAAMVRSGATTHPCDVRRGLHLQRLVEKARTMALARPGQDC
jgi:predicted dehydrogenase